MSAGVSIRREFRLWSRDESSPGLTLAALTVALLMLGLVVALESPARAAAVTGQEVAEGLTCQCGCGLTVANCNHPSCSFSVPMRQKIDAMLAGGMGRAEIIAYFRSQYGEKILSAPTTTGFNLLAWTMPFAAIVLGGLIVAVVMGRWRGSSQPAPPEPPTRIDPVLRERLEREIKERI
jgi:cytochrome c-type biogenesis protein CcmH/NrfF